MNSEEVISSSEQSSRSNRKTGIVVGGMQFVLPMSLG